MADYKRSEDEREGGKGSASGQGGQSSEMEAHGEPPEEAMKSFEDNVAETVQINENQAWQPPKPRNLRFLRAPPQTLERYLKHLSLSSLKPNPNQSLQFANHRLLETSAAEATTFKTAAHLPCVLALGKKQLINYAIIPIHLLPWICLCRRPPRSAEIRGYPPHAATFLFCFRAFEKSETYTRFAPRYQIRPQTAASVLSRICSKRNILSPHNDNISFWCSRSLFLIPPINLTPTIDLPHF